MYAFGYLLEVIQDLLLVANQLSHEFNDVTRKAFEPRYGHKLVECDAFIHVVLRGFHVL